MKQQLHNVDFCVVGGGMAGLCAALAASRKGLRTVLVHDRPVLGGNASSEIRMWVCGAHGADKLESGIIEEILLENLYRNSEGNYSIWDSVLYGKARYQPNLTLLLNTTCLDADALTLPGGVRRINSIRAWELNAETMHTVTAAYFADCSGDSILAEPSGAEFRYGREGRSESGEDIAPEKPDRKTMGLSCLIQGRETDHAVTFRAPEWANKYASFDEFKERGSLYPDAHMQNYWWIELGGSGDALHDAALWRDELLKVCFGVWDLIKNHETTCDKYRNWELDWVGFLPGKRESRRYVGDIVMSKNDVVAGGDFPDTVAYGGWSMDDHHPDGLAHPGAPNIYHPAPSPYGIPYRALYSRNVENLFFAGRNISVTHMALSSTRVMSTCAICAQAVGAAAAIAVKRGVTPRGVYEKHLNELQQTLMRDDAWLPNFKYQVDPAVVSAVITASNSADPSGLRSGANRVVDGLDLAWHGGAGDSVTYTMASPVKLKSVRVVFDSDSSRRQRNITANRPLNCPRYLMPDKLCRAFRLECLDFSGVWRELACVNDNRNRLFAIDTDATVSAIRLTLLETWGSETVRVFAFDFETASGNGDCS